MEKKVTAAVTFEVLSVNSNSVTVRIMMEAEGGVATSSERKILMVGECYTIRDLRLTVSGA